MRKPIKHRVGAETGSWCCFIRWFCTGCSRFSTCFNTVRREQDLVFCPGFCCRATPSWVYSSSKRHQRSAAPLFVVFSVVLPLILHSWWLVPFLSCAAPVLCCVGQSWGFSCAYGFFHIFQQGKAKWKHLYMCISTWTEAGSSWPSAFRWPHVLSKSSRL